MNDQINIWKEKLGIEAGMTRSQAIDKFLEWQSGKKTCQRCKEFHGDGRQYTAYCPLNLICKEAMDYESRREIDIRGGNIEDFRHKETGFGIHEERIGTALCEGV